MPKSAVKNDFSVWSEIDLGHLRHNLKAIRSWVGKGAGILAVVKADAYGHGMREVSRALEKEGVGFFGVATLLEALALRKICPKARILVLGSFHKDQPGFFLKNKITPTLSSIEDALVFSKALPKAAGPYPVHVKIDTGMGRLGVWHEEAQDLFRILKRLRLIWVEGIYTHFSSADAKKPDITHKQIAHFESLVEKARKMGFSPRYLHAANSSGLLHFKNSHFNLVRPGILLYGINPAKDKKLPLDLKPVLSLKTRIAFLKSMPRGRAVSYGGTHQTSRDTQIATLPIGYSHGYRVGFSNKAFVAIRGRKCPVVGRVTMDQTLVDVGHLPLVKRWDEATLIGKNGSLLISAQNLAGLIDTIPYEIVCSIHSRIPRIYKN
jgi:alanine racemase